jgi:hypothetical protein
VATKVDAGPSASGAQVRVRCQAGVRTVHLTLPVTWEDTLSDQALLAAITQELGREG